MNPTERLFATCRGEKTDCYAVTPYNGNFAIHLSGMKLGKCYTDGKKLAQAQIIAWEKIGQDVVVAQSEQYYIAEGLGVKTRLHENALPEVLARPGISLDEEITLKPIDPYRDGRAYVYIEAVGHLAQHFKGEVPIRAPGAGPFTLAGHLMDLQPFIMAMALAEQRKDAVRSQRILDVIEVAYESHYRYCEACVKAGASIVQLADSLASLDIISPAIYEKYAYPFEKRFFERIAALKGQYSFLTLLHICGNNTKIVDKLMQTGCDILEVDYKVDLGEYMKLADGRLTLMGNLNPAGALLHGTEDEVERQVRTAVQQTGNGRRYLVGSGCEVAVQAPWQNVRRMVQVGHSLAPV